MQPEARRHDADHGAPFVVDSWRSLRIERRCGPTLAAADAPDGRHCVDVWTYVDSRGRRSGARLSTTWRNPEAGSIELLPQGAWEIAAAWLAKDRVELRVAPVAGAVVPPVPSTWRDLAIELRRP